MGATSLEKVIALFSLPVSASLGRAPPTETPRHNANNDVTRIIFFISWSPPPTESGAATDPGAHDQRASNRRARQTQAASFARLAGIKLEIASLIER
jgi:hypothetical protein